MARKILSPDTAAPEPLRSVAAMKAAIMALADSNIRALEKELILNPNQIGGLVRLLDIVDKIQRMEDPEPQRTETDTAASFGLK